jgi:hypothetical protein
VGGKVTVGVHGGVGDEVVVGVTLGKGVCVGGDASIGGRVSLGIGDGKGVGAAAWKTPQADNTRPSMNSTTYLTNRMVSLRE